MQLRTQIHVSLITRQVQALRQAVEAGHADYELGCRAVIYARRETRLVSEGRRNGEVSVAVVAGLARAVACAQPQPEDRSVPREAPSIPFPSL